MLTPDATIEPSAETLRAGEALFNALAGSILLSGNQTRQSVPYYREAARLSDDPRLLEHALLIVLSVKDYEGAVPIAEKLTRLSSAPADALQRNLALLYVQAGKYDEALASMEALIAADAPAGAAYDTFMAIGVLLAQHAGDSAMTFLGELAERHPEHPAVHLVRAILAIQMNDLDDALTAVNLAEQYGADETKAAIVRARALLAKNELEAGLEVMRVQVERNPDNTDLRSYYAARLIENEFHQRALEQYTLLNAALPGKPLTVMRIGYLHLQLNKLPEAAARFKELQQWPEYAAQAHYYLGRTAEQGEDLDAALDSYRQVDSEQTQLFMEALVARVRIRTQLGQTEEALHALKDSRTFLTDSSSITKVYLIQGELLEKSDRESEALAAYTEGLHATSMNNAALLFARALVSHKLKSFDDAEADLKRILTKNPDDAGALNALGYILADLNVRLKEAEKYIKRAYELVPDDAAIIDSMGWVAFRLNDLEAAERYLRLALSYSQEAEIIGHLVEVLRRKRAKAAADELLKQGLNLFPDHEYLLRLNQPERPAGAP